MSRHGQMWHDLTEAHKWLDVDGSAVIRHYMAKARAAASIGDYEAFAEAFEDARFVQHLRTINGTPHPGSVHA